MQAFIINDANKNGKNKGNSIICKKLEKNELTDIEDLNVIIKPSENSKEFIINTNPIKYTTIRKLNDFEYLYQKLNLINSRMFNPLLITEDLKTNSKDILAINLYINSVVESPYYRSLPIVYDFLKLSSKDWENAKKDKYDGIREVKDFKNLEGFFNLEKIEENKFLKIEGIIKSRVDTFKKN